MDDITIYKRIQEKCLILDAFQESSKWSIFIFAVDGTEIAAAVIKSDETEPNTLKIYRGYGIKLAIFKPENKDPIYYTILGKHNIQIMRFDEEQDKLDSISFKGEIIKQNDVLLYGFRMECVKVRVGAIHYGD